MNRLSCLIERRVGAMAPPVEWPLPRPQQARQALLSDDVKLFALAWLGGLIFFGTYFG